MRKITPNIMNYTQAGIAAFLPGMRRMVELMQQAVQEMEMQLESLQERPDYAHKRAAASKTGWEGMTAEERSEEMKRRQKVARAKQFINARRESASNRWAQKTPAQRRKWAAAIKAGKERAAAEKAKQLNGAA